MTAEIGRRSILFAFAGLLLTVILFFASRTPSRFADTLPVRLTDAEFWHMVTDFSESGGYFRYENFLSNEVGYQYVIPTLKRTIPPGGVYMGVGPEQNFTYIGGLQSKMAFVVDIRRQNMLEHLFYKALMETSSDRVEFLSRLFARPRPASLSVNAAPAAIFDAYRSARPSSSLFETNLHGVLEFLEKQKGFGLSMDDEAAVRRVAQAFFESGPDLRYTFAGGFGGFSGFMGMPTYAELATENDGTSHNWHFLATEEQFQAIQRLQKNNLIVPLVGDFAGPRAIRSVARYLEQHHALLNVFYTSNVEQYLFQDDEDWRKFYENVAVLPVDSTSTFIRYVLNRGYRRREQSLLSPIGYIANAYQMGRIQGYYDVIDMSR
jgi:hypothetical protein